MMARPRIRSRSWYRRRIAMPPKRAVHLILGLLLLPLVACAILPASDKYQTFLRSHAAIRPGMTLRQVLEAGLADYKGRVGANLPGATVPKKQPVSEDCQRYVLDMSFSKNLDGPFFIQVFCNHNGPSGSVLVPARSFESEADFLQALETEYSSWAKSMEFTVSSPEAFFGPLHHYNFVLDENGKVATVSPVYDW
jgi:hypothetical protein